MPKFDGVPIRIADLADATDILDGFEFVNCKITGPAVLAILDRVSLVQNSFDGEFDSLLWEVAPTRKRIIGAIGIQNCSFTRCDFSRIGLAGPPEFIRSFRRGTARTTP